MKTNGKFIKILSIIIVLSILLIMPVSAEKTDDNKNYPFVFVHGVCGWGGEEGVNNILPYWGTTTGSITKYLTSLGYSCYDASVGPISSAWDRACELYAQLTGTTVDYGIYHSQQMNHKRFGRTYTEPLIENWGETDSNGNINKVNLIAHSFGGATVRILLQLLAEGSADEISATSPDDISPLFTGGHEKWVHSITTIASPHNSTSLYTALKDLQLLLPVKFVLFAYAELMSTVNTNGFFDSHLEQFGIDENTDLNSYKDILNFIEQAGNDTAEYDLSPEGASKINKFVDIQPDVYYLSIPFNTTDKLPLTDYYIPKISTNPFNLIPALLMCFGASKNCDDVQIDDSWRENDSLVSTVSATYPFDEPHTEYDKNNIQKGIWNVLPIQTGDHFTPMGLFAKKSNTYELYKNLVEIISSLEG